MRMSCRRYPPLLQLLLILPSVHSFSKTPAFSVSRCHHERQLLHRRGPSPILASDQADDDHDVAYSPSQSFHLDDHIYGNKIPSDFRLGRLLRRWNVPLMSLLASAMIAFPSPTVAASVDQRTYSTSDHGGTSWSSSHVLAANDFSSISPSSIADLGLKPPTEEKPQIMLNARSSPGGVVQQPPTPNNASASSPRKSNSREPVLQGLVYFPERAPADPAAKIPTAGPQVKQQLDYYSDVLVLTAVSASRPEGPVLAGAKFPVSSVRFPFSFQMFEENLLTSRPGVREAWEGVASTGDIILRANICPSDASAFPCDEGETKKYAEGVAKLITNLPGLEEGRKIRAPASLALQ